MRFTIRITAILLLTLCAFAAELPPEIRLWPNGAPGSEGKTASEVVDRGANGQGERRVFQVHQPSLTPYLPPKDKATGVAVLVIPGGGHRMLAIDHEGYNVAEWLQARGIAAFVLKHRLARETNSTYTIKDHAEADARRAMRHIRAHAAEWNVDPKKVGALGFSAGGELVAAATIRFDTGDLNATDPVERHGSRPDFQALIYPGRSGDIQALKDSPPAFLACAWNDRQDIAEGLTEVYLRFKRAQVPVELHIYSSGGHGFGLRPNNKRPVDKWADRFAEWLVDRKFLPEPSAK